jgi:hypothetical protein
LFCLQEASAGSCAGSSAAASSAAAAAAAAGSSQGSSDKPKQPAILRAFKVGRSKAADKAIMEFFACHHHHHHPIKP